ncbi:glycoside hydrolase family 15 protein [Baekduia sp. Peel2402]|uniref:glycoside hydrolase family 15 protein n=1 Tax=Baekduia sp. Peel2402 TaxID=3458296 RepID=UPI00403E48D5
MAAPEVGDLALLSDCQTAALVSMAGAVVWWPGPRFDSPSAFSQLLDADAGHFSIAPVAEARTTRAYLDGTLVLRTEHRTATGAVSVTDALALDPAARGHEIGMASPHALVRVVEALEGEVELDVAFIPRLEYGLVVPWVGRDLGLVQTEGGPERLFLSGGEALELSDRGARGRLVLRAGQRHGFVLQRVTGPRASAPMAIDADGALASTAEAWRSWSAQHDDYDGPYREEVARARLVVQGMTYQPTGAIVGAATTSLPEVPGGEANWDYRYAWLRDGGMVARALLRVTCSDEARRYFEWAMSAAVSCRQDEDVQIVFGVEGERHLGERQLDHLDGFASSRPVRIGNAAWEQRQLDAFGELLDVADALGDDLELDERTREFLCQLVDRAAEQWRQPDAGIWEERDRERHHTLSKVMCWVALDRGLRLADRLGAATETDRWRTARDEIRATVLREAYNKQRGAFTGVLGGDELDAAVLILPLVGFIDADDERMVATVRALQKALGADGLLHRVERIDDAGAFLPTTFWLAAVQAQAGDTQTARATIDRALACANDLGLLAELGDPLTSKPMGNVPQVLSHVALISAVARLAAAEARDEEAIAS